MSFADSQFASNTKAVLNESAICWLNFKLGKIEINAWYYAPIRYYIDTQQIRCKIDADKVPAGATAAYDTKAKAIFGSDSDTQYYYQRSTLIHECTHAVLDTMRTQTDILTDESCAYLAQALYIYASQKPPQFNGDSIAAEAYRAVKAKGLVIQGSTNLGSPIEFTKSDVADLQQSIKLSPLYKNWASKSSYAGY